MINHKLSISILSAAIMLPLAVMADGNVSGVVVDKDGVPLEFATVRVENPSNGTLVKGVTADVDGKFVISGLPDGSYALKIASVGSEPQTLSVTVAGKNINVGKVTLGENSNLLKEVVVEGVRGQMSFDLDRRVFHVDANIAAAGLSASELLESVPSVEVDQDGEVSLRGNSSVTVWINGKESGLTADNRAQILEQIPAESIERIEVITNPSAKYSPEGTAGIINIVLKRDRRYGYFGSSELGINTQGGGNANFNINFNQGKWESFAGIGLRMRHSKGGSMSRRSYDNGDYLNSDGYSRNHGNNIFLRLGTTFHATDADDVYFSGFGMLGHNWGRSVTGYVSNLPDQWVSNINTSRNNGDMRGAHAEVGYKHNWSDTHNIDINFGVNHWGGPGMNTYLQEQIWADQTSESVLQEQSRDIGTDGMEAKIDYTNQLNSWLKLEAGYNGRFDHEDSPVTTLQGTSEADLVISPELYNRFIYDNDINALYFTLGGKVSKFSFSGGVRAEDWYIHTRSVAYGQKKEDAPLFKKNKGALFPSAFVSYSLPHDNEVQINYTRRIRRPWGGQLNSFVDISNPTNLSYGNPELKSQYSNSFELNYIKTWTYHIISLSAYLRTTEQDINRISYLDGDVMYSTWANVGSQTNSGCEIVAKNQFFGRLDLTTTVNLYNSHIDDWSLEFKNGDRIFPVSGKGRDDFSWDIRSMAQVRLPWSMSFQATGRYNARRYSAQGSREPGWSVDAGIRKNIGDWSISLNCRDLFDSMKWHSYTYGDGYDQENKGWRTGRTVRLTIKYAFGNMKTDRRGHDGADGSDGYDASNGYDNGSEF